MPKTIWNRDMCPGINPDNLNKIEDRMDKDIWDYLYYADEEDPNARILAMDRDLMVLAKEIPLTQNAHVGSVDRAGFTDRMYCRTATGTGDPHIEVINAVSGKWIKKIPLNYRPRSSGGFNRYRNLQALSTKDNPWANVIDIDSDTVVITVGNDYGPSEGPKGNDGGNATGHTVWLDANHFALLDRHLPGFRIYKIDGNYPPYSVNETDTITTPTGCHSLRCEMPGLLLQDTVFYAAIEGELGTSVLPQMIKYDFDASTGTLTQNGAAITFPGVDASWNIHHFGCGNGKLVVPVMQETDADGEVFVIDLATWALEPTSFTAGIGAGHANYSEQLDMWVITNHYDNRVTLIEMDTGIVTHVTIAAETESYGTYIQSHANHVTQDGLFYHFFETANGIFIEIDLTTKTKTREVTTGGKPIQSVS